MSSPLLKGPPPNRLAIKLPFIRLHLKLPFRVTRGLASPAKGRPWPGRAVGSAVIVATLSSFLVGLPVWSPVRSNEPVAVVEVCRAGVEPCQRELNAPIGEPVALDLFISGSAPDQGEQPLNLVAWETHFILAGDAALRLFTQSLAGQSNGQSQVGLPVRERGQSRYALAGLVQLEAEIPGPDADYYTVQNRFSEETGQLDYAVALLGSGRLQPLATSSPGSRQDRWLIGRIVFYGQNPGSIQVSPNREADLPFQAISLSESGDRLPVPLSAGSPLATVRVGLSDPTLDLEGQMDGSSSKGTSSMESVELVVTFWNPGAVPTWRQGLDEPVATFRELVSDGNGRFRIADTSPTILPPGPYDVRVKARHTLGSRASRVSIPASDSELFASRALAVMWDSLRFGDVDDNHVVDAADVAALKTSFARRPGEAKFNSQADFNSDQVVDGQDFSFLAQNYLTRSQ